MKLNFSFFLFVGAAIGLSHISSCASKNQNDESLEATEPTEAASQATDDTAAKQPETSGAAEAPAAPAPAGDLIPSAPASTSTATPPSTTGYGAGVSASGRRVMYVKVSGAALRETPDPKGKVAGILEKGDHMLVTIQGDWARTDDGKYISMKVLSDKGVGRGKKDATWSAGKPLPAGEAATTAKSEITKKLPKKTANKAKSDGKPMDANDATNPSGPTSPAAESNQQQ